MFGSNAALATRNDGAGDQKRRFAALLLRDPADPYKAACDIFGDDRGAALQAAARWPDDPEVKHEIERLEQEHGSLHFLPDKATVCREIITKARGATSISDSLKAYDLYAELMEMKPAKTGGGGNANVFVGGQGAAKVMVVTKHGNDDDWSSQAERQQQRLIDMAAEDLRELEDKSIINAAE